MFCQYIGFIYKIDPLLQFNNTGILHKHFGSDERRIQLLLSLLYIVYPMFYSHELPLIKGDLVPWKRELSAINPFNYFIITF